MSDWKSDEIGELAKALAKVQGTIKDAVRRADGQAGTRLYKYADLGEVLGIVRPALTAVGLSVAQLCAEAPAGFIAVETVMMHESGQWIKGRLTLPREDREKMEGAKLAGIAITYARRYALAAIVGITQEDQDGSVPPGGRRDEPAPAPSPPAVACRDQDGITEEQIATIRARARECWPGLEGAESGANIAAVAKVKKLPTKSSDMTAREAAALIAAFAEVQKNIADGADPFDLLPF